MIRVVRACYDHHIFMSMYVRMARQHNVLTRCHVSMLEHSHRFLENVKRFIEDVHRHSTHEKSGDAIRKREYFSLCGVLIRVSKKARGSVHRIS